MIAKDCTGRLPAVTLSVGLLIPRGKYVSGHVSERFFFLRYAIEIACEDDVQVLGIAMSTVASEKYRELLFTGNEFCKQ